MLYYTGSSKTSSESPLNALFPLDVSCLESLPTCLPLSLSPLAQTHYLYLFLHSSLAASPHSLLDLFLQVFPSSFLMYCNLSFSQIPLLFWVYDLEKIFLIFCVSIYFNGDSTNILPHRIGGRLQGTNICKMLTLVPRT